MAVLPPDPIFNLRCPEMGPVHSICFHQNERILAGTLSGKIHLWDLQTNRSPLHFDAGNTAIQSLHHSEDVLYSQEKGGTVKCWVVENSGYVLKLSFNGNHTGYCRTEISEDCEILVVPKNENEIVLLSADDFLPLQTLSPSVTEKLGLLCSIRLANCRGQYYIIAGYESGHVLTWDLRCSKAIDHEKFDECPMALDYDPYVNRGVCGGSTDRIGVFSYKTNTMEIEKKSDITIKNAGINCIRIRPDQKVFVSGGWDGRIRIFSWKSLRPLAVLTEHKSGGVMDIAFSTDKVSMWKAPVMAAAGVDGQITLWDLYN